MKHFLLIFLAFAFVKCNGQNNTLFTAGISYTVGPPTVNAGNHGSKIAIDTGSRVIYANIHGTSWMELGWTLQSTVGCIAPAYTPTKFQSKFVINGCDSLYYYSGSAWKHLNPGGGGGPSYTAGYGIGISGTVISADTSQLATVNDANAAKGVHRLWPISTVNQYAPDQNKKNWIIYPTTIQPSSTVNAFMKFDTVSDNLSSLTNTFNNGIWMVGRSGAGDMVSGFSNNLIGGLGFNYFSSSFINLSDWRQPGTRGSILKGCNWTGASAGDMSITLFRDRGLVTSGVTKTQAGDELGVIRFCGSDTTRATSSTNPFTMPAPSSAIVGYNFKTPFNNAYYGGIGIWTTNGSLTHIRAFTVDSTASTTVRFGVNTTPASTNTFQVNGTSAMSGAAVIGATTRDASAALTVTSTTSGLLFPRMTETQRNAIASPTDGLVIYNTTATKLQVRAGGAWVNLH